MAVALALSATFACEDTPIQEVTPGDIDEPEYWHFERMSHELGDVTLTDVWGRSDGAVFIVGWYGTILTNRPTAENPTGEWHSMSSGTREHLTAIWGVENGRRFGQNRVDGEMFAVGWSGTLLYYHPNPDDLDEPQPEDGRWMSIAGPEVGFTPVLKIDPHCPDYDGDGIADDGGGGAATGGPDGWWSRASSCTADAQASCDDNCRTTPNGTQRPVVDLDGDMNDGQTCLEAGQDGPSPSAVPQHDSDGDGIGDACDPNGDEPDVAEGFHPTLFDVWAQAHGDGLLRVIAVGENGTLITYDGPDGATPVEPPAAPVTERASWIAQEQLAYHFTDDCIFAADAVAPGNVCQGTGRLPASCPAQCAPYRTNCSCPPDQGQCCWDAAGTGAACDGPTCGDRQGLPADSACGTVTAPATGNPLPGECSTLCPYCFRRMNKTLRSVVADGERAIVVGANGVALALDMASQGITGVWVRPACGPAPLDEQPLLTAVSRHDQSFHVVGAAGLVAHFGSSDGGACPLSTRCGAPPAFLSGVYSTGAQRAYAVGDAGVLVELRGESSACGSEAAVSVIETGLQENILAIWVTRVEGQSRLWLVGANGLVVRAGYY